MALDGLARALHAARLNHVRIERALHQPVHAARFLRDAMRLVVEHRDELRANPFSLGLGIGHAGQLRQESLARIHGDHVQPQLVAQILLHIFKFVLAQHTVVHKDAGQLAADRLVHQHRRNR